MLPGVFIKSWKTSAVSTTVWMVETQLCKLRGTSDEFCVCLFVSGWPGVRFLVIRLSRKMCLLLTSPPSCFISNCNSSSSSPAPNASHRPTLAISRNQFYLHVPRVVWRCFTYNKSLAISRNQFYLHVPRVVWRCLTYNKSLAISRNRFYLHVPRVV